MMRNLHSEYRDLTRVVSGVKSEFSVKLAEIPRQFNDRERGRSATSLTLRIAGFGEQIWL